MRFEFDWDPNKAASNLAKHHVSFEEAMEVFLDPLALSQADDFATGEERWITLGKTRAEGLLLVVHTHAEIAADAVLIRIISARRPTRREKRQYLEGEAG